MSGGAEAQGFFFDPNKLLGGDANATHSKASEGGQLAASSAEAAGSEQQWKRLSEALQPPPLSVSAKDRPSLAGDSGPSEGSESAEGRAKIARSVESAAPAVANRDSSLDPRSLGRPPRLRLRWILGGRREDEGIRPTQVGQEARGVYFLILISLSVDWLAWFILIYGLLGNFIKDELLPAGTSDFYPALACGFIGGLFPIAFAIFEVMFFRADLSRNKREEDSLLSTFAKVLRNYVTEDNQRIFPATLAIIIIIFIIVASVVYLNLSYSALNETLLIVIVFVLWLAGTNRFGPDFGTLFAIRAGLIVFSAYITSYPLELLLHREQIEASYIRSQKDYLASRVALQIQQWGPSPPLYFSPKEVEFYLSRTGLSGGGEGADKAVDKSAPSSLRQGGEIPSLYAACLIRKAAATLGGRKLERLNDEYNDAELELKKLKKVRVCANICATKINTSNGQVDVDKCLEALRTDPAVSSTFGLDARCKQRKNYSAEQRVLDVNEKIAEYDARIKLLESLPQKFADAHAACINSLISDISSVSDDLAPAGRTGGPPVPDGGTVEASASHESSRQNVDPDTSSYRAKSPTPFRRLSELIIFRNRWGQLLIPEGKDGVPTLDKNYLPKLCKDAPSTDRQMEFCVKPPGLSQRIQELAKLQEQATNLQAKLFALFVALVLPLLVILNKLLASEEFVSSLSRKAEWPLTEQDVPKDALMAVVLSAERHHNERTNALLRLIYQSNLTDRDCKLIRALNQDNLSDIIARAPIGQKSK